MATKGLKSMINSLSRLISKFPQEFNYGIVHNSLLE